MRLVWRLCSPPYASKLDGEGNRRHGARWNSPGRGVVYVSAHLSLAVLEMLAHLPPELTMAVPPLAAVAIEIPDRSEELVSLEEMPKDPAILATWCRARGDAWLRSGSALSLVAPSLIVPQELNVMLNPSHSDMQTVRIAAVEEFRLDERLLVRSF
ncbi:MAG: RES family NAD+ phosphorylase [Hyphomicrobiales bacterium]